MHSLPEHGNINQTLEKKIEEKQTKLNTSKAGEGGKVNRLACFRKNKKQKLFKG